MLACAGGDDLISTRAPTSTHTQQQQKQKQQLKQVKMKLKLLETVSYNLIFSYPQFLSLLLPIETTQTSHTSRFSPFHPDFVLPSFWFLFLNNFFVF